MPRVLLVDDSTAMRSILKKMLRNLNFELFEATNGQEALVKLQEVGMCELALVDWNMPVMNGYELIKEVRKNRDYDRMVIIMVTTETEPLQIAKALAAGANEYIMKPFTEDIVIEKLKLMGVL